VNISAYFNKKQGWTMDDWDSLAAKCLAKLSKKTADLTDRNGTLNGIDDWTHFCHLLGRGRGINIIVGYCMLSWYIFYLLDIIMVVHLCQHSISMDNGHILSTILGASSHFVSQWPFQEPKLEVPTIYIRPIFQAYVRGYTPKIWPEIWY
jgi:hypothetical protein